MLEGIDWVTANARRPAVSNMSLGGGASQSVDDAVERPAQSGILYSVTAGNRGEDACNDSPARAEVGTDNGIVTTAATNSTDVETVISNYALAWTSGRPGRAYSRPGRGRDEQEERRLDGLPARGGGSRPLPLLASRHGPLGHGVGLTAAALRPGATSKDGHDLSIEGVGGF